MQLDFHSGWISGWLMMVLAWRVVQQEYGSQSRSCCDSLGWYTRAVCTAPSETVSTPRPVELGFPAGLQGAPLTITVKERKHHIAHVI